MNAVELRGVSFAYDERTVVEDVSLTVEEGGFHALVGPNGGGKTTVLKLASGRLKPDSGSAELFGVPSAEFTDGARIGYIGQDPPEVAGRMPISVREVVRLGRVPAAGLRRLGRGDAEAVADAIDTVGLQGMERRRIGSLSGGQRQRAYIARALAGEPDLLVLDEPTVGVDVEAQEEFYDLLDDLNENGVTVLMVEHDLEVVAERADTLTCVNGRVYYDGAASEFVDSDEFYEAYGSRRPPSEEVEP